MGWLSSPVVSQTQRPEIIKFVSDVKKAGFTHALLLGMGGSSLAPEVMSLIYGKSVSGLKLTVLDSTDPGQVLQASRNNPVLSTLFIVSSKSGGTAEVNALFAYFWERAKRTVGDKAGEHYRYHGSGYTLLKKWQWKEIRRIFWQIESGWTVFSSYSFRAGTRSFDGY
jgi:transaldolase/glucose-6-phosphate isomerase